MNFRNRFNSFRHAFNGWKIAFKEPNFKIHLVCAGLAVILGFAFSIHRMEWVAIVVVTGIVLISETINTAIEYLADAVTTQPNEWIKKCKDAAAGAVLLSACMAVIVAAIVFGPKLVSLFQ